MTNLTIEATKKNPFVDFKTEGKLFISGNSIGNDHVEFYGILMDWCSKNLSKNVEFDINIEYMNTGSSQSLIGLIDMLSNNDAIEILTINWHYDEDDIDMLEFGQNLEKTMPKSNFMYTTKECA